MPSEIVFLDASERPEEGSNKELDCFGMSDQTPTTVRMIQTLEGRVKTELAIRPENFTTGMAMNPEEDSPTEAMVEKFLAAESAVTETLEKYHSNLSALVCKVHGLGEKCREGVKQEQEGNEKQDGEEKETEKEGGEPTEEERLAQKKEFQEKMKNNLQEWSAEVREYLVSFASEASTFYSKMGALYENLYLELGGETKQPENAPQENKSEVKGDKIIGNKQRAEGMKQPPSKNPTVAKKTATQDPAKVQAQKSGSAAPTKNIKDQKESHAKRDDKAVKERSDAENQAKDEEKKQKQAAPAKKVESQMKKKQTASTKK